MEANILPGGRKGSRHVLECRLKSGYNVFNSPIFYVKCDQNKLREAI